MHNHTLLSKSIPDLMTQPIRHAKKPRFVLSSEAKHANGTEPRLFLFLDAPLAHQSPDVTDLNRPVPAQIRRRKTQCNRINGMVHMRNAANFLLQFQPVLVTYPRIDFGQYAENIPISFVSQKSGYPSWNRNDFRHASAIGEEPANRPTGKLCNI